MQATQPAGRQHRGTQAPRGGSVARMGLPCRRHTCTPACASLRPPPLHPSPPPTAFPPGSACSGPAWQDRSCILQSSTVNAQGGACSVHPCGMLGGCAQLRPIRVGIVALLCKVMPKLSDVTSKVSSSASCSAPSPIMCMLMSGHRDCGISTVTSNLSANAVACSEIW